MNKLLSLLLVLSLIVTSSLVVYADDSETSGSDPEVPVSEEQLEEVYSDMRVTSEKLTAVLNASNDNVTYTTDDIYNLLLSLFNNGSNLSQNSLILHIKQLCQTINTSCNALVSNSTLIKNMLTNSDNTINIYDLVGDHLGNIASELELVLSSGTHISITELLNFVYQEIQTSNDNLVTIQNMLSTLNATSSSINNHVNTISGINAAIQANTLNTVTAVNNLRSDYNDINWNTLSDYYLGFKHNYNDESYITGTFNYESYPIGYFFFRSPNLSGGNLYTFGLPVRASSVISNDFIDSIQIVYNDSSYTPIYYYEYDYTKNFVKVICVNSGFQYSSSRPVVFKVTFKRNYNVTTSSYNIQYLSSNSKDFIDMYQYFTDLKINKITSKFEYLYASDDLIAAKEEQQPYESQAIEDFTGSGSAAASTSDLGDLKSVSNTIKSGLSSGGSVSNALAPFDANGGFWDWFKQDNYNNINNLSGNNQSLLRSTPSQPDVIDFYTNNQLTLQGLLGGN